MMNIIIDSEFEKLIPPLTDDEYRGLEESIKNEGIRKPIDLWNGTIVDGHNRYKIAQKHNLDCDSEGKEFDSRDDAIIWIIQNQFNRRNLTTLAKGLLALKLKPLVSARAKKNQIRKPNSVCTNWNEQNKSIDTMKEVAKAAGIGRGTLYRIQCIEESDNEEVKEKVRSGEMSISKADNVIRSSGDGIKRPVRTDDEAIIISVFSLLQSRLVGFENIAQKRKAIFTIIEKLSSWAEEL